MNGLELTTMNGHTLYAALTAQPPLSDLPPLLAGFFKEYLSCEKAIRFDGKWTINTQFPPYPSRAFDNLTRHFMGGEQGAHRLYSVTWAVTNRCIFNCWHCYNAGRSTRDVPLRTMRRIAHDLQDLGACMVTLTGGEPLLREDLEEVAACFDDRACIVVGTTGFGLTEIRAQALRAAGVFAVGISLDSDVASEHDRMRGRIGAHRAALTAISAACRAGLYTYVVSLATRDFLRRERFLRFLDFVKSCGAMEVHLLEPTAVGRLTNRRDVLLTETERAQIIAYQREVALRDDLPILSAFTYIESPDAFGCGAGLTHVYIDGSGELSPCNLVPLSFGNVACEELPAVLERMSRCFRHPRAGCVGHLLSQHVPPGALPTPPEVSERICRAHLPESHPLPRFFRIRAEARQ